MRMDNERDVVLQARHAAQRIKSELEYTLSRVLDNVESVRSAGGLPLLNELRGKQRSNPTARYSTACRAADDLIGTMPLAKMSARPDKAPGASDTRSVSDPECTLASVRTSHLPCRHPIHIIRSDSYLYSAFLSFLSH